MPSSRAIADSDDLPWSAMAHGFSARIAAVRATHRIPPLDLPGHAPSPTIDHPHGDATFADRVAEATARPRITGACDRGTHAAGTAGLPVAAHAPGPIGAGGLPAREPPDQADTPLRDIATGHLSEACA